MKYSTLLLDLLFVKDWSFLPNYPFNLSLDEYIEEVYNKNDLEEIRQLENYCKYCLDNLELLIQENL